MDLFEDHWLNYETKLKSTINDNLNEVSNNLLMNEQ